MSTRVTALKALLTACLLPASSPLLSCLTGPPLFITSGPSEPLCQLFPLLGTLLEATTMYFPKTSAYRSHFPELPLSGNDLCLLPSCHSCFAHSRYCHLIRLSLVCCLSSQLESRGPGLFSVQRSPRPLAQA